MKFHMILVDHKPPAQVQSMALQEPIIHLNMLKLKTSYLVFVSSLQPPPVMFYTPPVLVASLLMMYRFDNS